jgi:hypothetical protein
VVGEGVLIGGSTSYGLAKEVFKMDLLLVICRSLSLRSVAYI